MKHTRGWMIVIKIRPIVFKNAVYEPPGDKSISHRALIISSLAGNNSIFGLSSSTDVSSTAECLRQLGVKIQGSGKETVVRGSGVDGFTQPSGELDCGNSGTTMRLLAGVLAGVSLTTTLSGDKSLLARPMRRVVTPLRTMGANISSPSEGDHPPLHIAGKQLQGIKWYMTVPSAQVKSCILLAALNARGESHVVQGIETRDHTERMLKYFGADIEWQDKHIRLRPSALTPRPIHVPGDISSAAYPAVLAAATPGSKLVITNVGLNPGRTGFLDVLTAMGARVSRELTIAEPEPVGTVVVEGQKLCGVTISGDSIPGLIDELPILAVAAALAEGRTIVRGAQELRIKESDRIAAIVQELCKMGASVQELSDGFLIEGGSLYGAAVDSHGDHRIAMSLAVAACLCSAGETVITGAEAASISYPGFWEDLKSMTGGAIDA